MVEGAFVKADKVNFSEFGKTLTKNFYIGWLALAAGLGGLLFGYDTGVISGALLYIREDFPQVDRKTFLQETIVSTAIGAAIFGAGIGGWITDKFGRKKSILAADVLFAAGSLVMALAQAPWMIILGRFFVGFGVGMASMTAPLYISEVSPTRIRGALVCINSVILTGGQFLSYVINLAFTNTSWTWLWMLGFAAAPAILQLILMLLLPESPRWLYRQNKVEEARSILAKIFRDNLDELDYELNALKLSVEAEKAETDDQATGASLWQKFLAYVKEGRAILKNVVVRGGLYAGITAQVAQQFSGINTVMYYSPTIVLLAGFASNKTALTLSLITSALNAIGPIVSLTLVDKYGRRRLMLVSMAAITVCLVTLSVVFFESARHGPRINQFDTNFHTNATCPSYLSVPKPTSWNCMSCLKAGCGFCANGVNQYAPGTCLAFTTQLKDSCRAQNRTWFRDGCPSKIGFVAVILLGLYIICFSPGMGTVPWILSSEIYPLKYRRTCGGIAALFNWLSNLFVSMTFLTITKYFGSAGTFGLFAGFCAIGFIFICRFVPETKGLPFEEVEEILEIGYKPRLFGGKPKGDNNIQSA